MRLKKSLFIVVLLLGGCMSSENDRSQYVMLNQPYALTESQKSQKIVKAKQGDSEAAFFLSMHYGMFTDVPNSMEHMFYWLNRAAVLGHVTAQHNLAVYYESDQDIRNVDLAVYWYKKAAAQGHEYAKEKVKKLSK